MKKKTIFWQDWGTYKGITMVCCGWKDYTEVKAFPKKKKYSEWERALTAKTDEFSSPHFSKWEYDGVTYHLLWLPDWKEDMNHYKILSHELLHAIQFCLTDFLNPIDEFEAGAYQHSYLFENIARTLNKELINKAKKK